MTTTGDEEGSSESAESGSFALSAGERLSRYQIVRGLARGGMGEVYLARMAVAGGHKLVALKRMLPTHMEDPEVRAMFVAEAGLALRLDHSGVVQVLDVVDDEGEHAIVMEYVHGKSARDIARAWRSQPSPSRATAVAIAIGTADALHYVHETIDEDGRRLGLVHRDVSPENIMVRFDGGIKLIDFGIAKISEKTAATKVGVLKGKIGYMSPEQIRQDPIDRRSDVFQLGIVCYELLTGRRPFVGDNFAAVMNAVLSGEPPSPRTHDPTMPEGLARIIERALAYEPEDRFASAAAMREALRGFAADEALDCSPDGTSAELERLFGRTPPPRTDPVFAPEAPTQRGSKHRVGRGGLAWLGAALVVAGLGAGAVSGRQRDAVASAATESLALAHHERAQTWAAVGGLAAVLGLGLAAVAWRRRAAVAMAAAATAGCAAPEYTCVNSRACDVHERGYCDAVVRRCAYPDDGCEGGARFGPLAGTRSAQCVEPLPEATTYAHFIDTAVEIDGDPGELALGRPLHLSSDFGVSADLWLRWNDEALFVGAVVTDPRVDATLRSHEPLWDEDGIEVLFDTAWDRAEGSMPASDDFKFVVTAINASSTSWGGIQPRTAWGLDIQSAVAVAGTANQDADVDEGYTVELRIPWSSRFAKPTAGAGWGMNVRINDRFEGQGRDLTWQRGKKLNHPSAAGVLGFAAGGTPQSLQAPPTPLDPREPFAAIALRERRIADSANFDEAQPVERLFDGCLGTRRNCAAGTEHDQRLWVRFDLGAEYELGAARLFGDTKHEWVSRSWDLRVRGGDDEPWTPVFEGRSAHRDGWVFADLASIRARYVEVAVEGDPGRGAEAAEIELYGRLAGSGGP